MTLFWLLQCWVILEIPGGKCLASFTGFFLSTKCFLCLLWPPDQSSIWGKLSASEALGCCCPFAWNFRLSFGTSSFSVYKCCDPYDLIFPWNLWYCSVTMGTTDFLNRVRIRQDGKRGRAFWVTKWKLNNRLIVAGGKRGVRFSGVMGSHGSGNKARYVGGNEKHCMTGAKGSHKWLEINPAGITGYDRLIVSPETCHSSLWKLLQIVTRELVTSEKEKSMNKHTFEFQYICMLAYLNWGSKSLIEANIFNC